MAVTIILHGDLNIFLPRILRNKPVLNLVLDRRTSIKDLLEAHGVPHPEINRLTVNGRETGFQYIVEPDDTLEVIPFYSPADLSHESLLRPPLDRITFAVDVNVAKLAKLLRMAGFDASCDPDLDDELLAEKAGRETRLLLTRDRALLKRRVVVYGHIVRSEKPAGQLREVVSLYNLKGLLKPFTRCLECNELLYPAKKEELLGRLEPLTKKYYYQFHLCPACDRIFWPGSHRDGMLKYLNGI